MGAPSTTEAQNQTVTEQVKNTEDFSAENTNTPFVTDSFEVIPGYSTITQQETSPANYPDTNHHRIVFPDDDEEETSFPAFPQTSVQSFSAQPSPSTSRSAPLKVTPLVSSTVAQPSPVQIAASQPFVTCPSAMKCVEKISCNFNGVMVDQPVLLNPEQEAQRVPLIVSSTDHSYVAYILIPSHVSTLPGAMLWMCAVGTLTIRTHGLIANTVKTGTLVTADKKKKVLELFKICQVLLLRTLCQKRGEQMPMANKILFSIYIMILE